MSSRIMTIVVVAGIATTAHAAFGQAARLPDCSRTSMLQNQFIQLTEQVDFDAKYIRNMKLGFDANVEEIQQATDLPFVQIEQVKDEFKRALFDASARRSHGP